MRSVSKCCELGNITLIQMVLAFAKSIFFFGSLDGESCRECSVFFGAPLCLQICCQGMPGNISKLVQSLGHWNAFACVNAPYGCKEVCNSVHMCLCVCNMLQGCAATAVKFDKASLRSPAHVAKPCGRESSIHIFISDISYLYIWKFMDFIWNRVLLPMQGFFLCLWSQSIISQGSR